MDSTDRQRAHVTPPVSEPGPVVAEPAAVEPEPDTWVGRLGLGALDYRIPAAGNRLRYMLGGLTAALIVILFLTGFYLAEFYAPDPQGAHDSVLYLIARAPLGDWIRSIHYWSAAALTVTLLMHLGYVFWRRSYRKPRELTWWAGVALAGLIFLMIVTGSALRNDEEGFEALAHFVAGGKLTHAIGGGFFTDTFTTSTSLLSRVFTLHTSLIPLLLVGLIGLHFWLIRHLGLHADYSRTSMFRTHLIRLTGSALLVFAGIGVLAALVPEGLGYPPIPGAEVTKPFWPVLWVYGLENVLGMWGMVLGPALFGGFLLAVPLLDRGRDDRPGIRSPVGWAGIVVALVVLAFWLYGVFGAARQHIGM